MNRKQLQQTFLDAALVADEMRSIETFTQMEHFAEGFTLTALDAPAYQALGTSAAIERAKSAPPSARPRCDTLTAWDLIIYKTWESLQRRRGDRAAAKVAALRERLQALLGDAVQVQGMALSIGIGGMGVAERREALEVALDRLEEGQRLRGDLERELAARTARPASYACPEPPIG